MHRYQKKLTIGTCAQRLANSHIRIPTYWSCNWQKYTSRLPFYYLPLFSCIVCGRRCGGGRGRPLINISVSRDCLTRQNFGSRNTSDVPMMGKFICGSFPLRGNDYYWGSRKTCFGAQERILTVAKAFYTEYFQGTGQRNINRGQNGIDWWAFFYLSFMRKKKKSWFALSTAARDLKVPGWSKGSPPPSEAGNWSSYWAYLAWRGPNYK